MPDLLEWLSHPSNFLTVATLLPLLFRWILKKLFSYLRRPFKRLCVGCFPGTDSNHCGVVKLRHGDQELVRLAWNGREAIGNITAGSGGEGHGIGEREAKIAV